MYYKEKKKRLISHKPLPFVSAVAAVNSFDSVAYLLASYYYLEPVAVVVDWAFDYYYSGPAAVVVAVERHLIVVISIAAVVVIITLVVAAAVVVEVVVDLVGYCSIVVVELVDHWHHPDYYQCYSDVVG